MSRSERIKDMTNVELLATRDELMEVLDTTNHRSIREIMRDLLEECETEIANRYESKEGK